MSEEVKRESKRAVRPMQDTESRTQQLINIAYNVAEDQMLSGKASPSIVCHFLKLGTERAKLEQLKIEREMKLLEAKVAGLELTQNSEQLAKDAVEAMTNYTGKKNEKL